MRKMNLENLALTVYIEGMRSRETVSNLNLYKWMEEEGQKGMVNGKKLQERTETFRDHKDLAFKKKKNRYLLSCMCINLHFSFD